MFFDGWSGIFRVSMVGVAAYAGLVILLRISGNRTLSKLSAFDLVVTVAFGSTLSAILVNQSVSLAVGLAALTLLVLLQLIITSCAVRFAAISSLVKTAPTVVLWEGKLCLQAMKAVRITADEVRGAVRQSGFGSLGMIDAVVLESDGQLSVIPVMQAGDRSAYGRFHSAAMDDG